MYVLIVIGSKGLQRFGQIDSPQIPEGTVRPGEIAFVVEALDFQSKYDYPNWVNLNS